MSKKSFTIGSDPEFFIVDKNIRPLKAAQFTPGTKDDTEDLGDGYNVHADNVMLELNIPPAVTKEGFVNNILTGKGKLQKLVSPHSLVTVATMIFQKDDLDKKHDWEIGCDPDKSAYTMADNPEIKLTSGMRYAGGHVHVGLPDELNELDTIISMVKAMDYLLMDMVTRVDKDFHRKEVYGTPGRFRFKDYGFEYRSLSNFWLRKTATIQSVYDIVEETIKNYEKYSTPENEAIVKKHFQTSVGKENKNKQTIHRVKLQKVND